MIVHGHDLDPLGIDGLTENALDAPVDCFRIIVSGSNTTVL
jgi:hypothetical protein